VKDVLQYLAQLYSAKGYCKHLLSCSYGVKGWDGPPPPDETLSQVFLSAPPPMVSLVSLAQCSKVLPSVVLYHPTTPIGTLRSFHGSTSRRDLVAPPHPVSHMRPVLYEEPPSKLPAQYLRHPYSLSEFKTELNDTASASDHELQFKLLRQQLDSLHQAFWLDVSPWSIRACVMETHKGIEQH